MHHTPLACCTRMRSLCQLPMLLFLSTSMPSLTYAAVATAAALLLPVAFAWLQKSVFIKRYNYYSLVTVGFSGVVFGLKVGSRAGPGWRQLRTWDVLHAGCPNLHTCKRMA